MNVRVACARILSAVMHRDASLNTLLPEYSGQVPERDSNLLQELCYGTLRHYPALVAISAKLLGKPLKGKDADVQALLLCGLYQIREMRTPAHAAVNESVAACQELKKPWARGMMNAALRRYLRERAEIDSSCAVDDDYRTLHPRWLVQRLTAAWGDEAVNIMAANNQRPPLCLRINQQKVSRDHYLSVLAEQAIEARPAPFSSQGIYLSQPCAVTELPGFAQGHLSVQDEAAQLSSGLLDLAPGQRVLDACCAPGGKTCHILEHQPDLTELLALDVDGERLVRVRENLHRLGFSATLKSADAGDPDSWWDGTTFDRILLDAPCSATGVIRRHPDIKLLRQPDDIAKLASIQLALLAALWPTLKVGGKLLYATCSVLPEENDRVIEGFAASHGDCTRIDIDAPWGVQTPWGRQLFPIQEQYDGFYYALLQKQPALSGGLAP